MSSTYPLIAVFGLDPTRHEMPPLLRHHMSKMAKDFPIVFWAEEDLNEDTWKAVRNLVKKTEFVPKVKQQVVTPDKGIIK